MANDIDAIPEEVMDKQCENKLSEELDEAVLREVAAQLRRIGDALNEEHAVKKLPSLPAMFGGNGLLSFITNMKL